MTTAQPMAAERRAGRCQRVSVRTYTVPTDRPESDGTLSWTSTTMVVVQVEGAGQTGLGYTYSAPAAAGVVRELLVPMVEGRDVMDVPGVWTEMVQAVRNAGRPGIASAAIAAVDTALWDLKAKVLNLPLSSLLGRVRESIDIYGSGGFTSYSLDELREQLGGWVNSGIRLVKMKVGREPGQDAARVHAARQAIGPSAGLFVDANGAFARKQALALAETFADAAVSWFEEPVSSDDLEGLSLVCERAPAGMEIAAGEYGYDLRYFRRLLEAGAVDVLQADATRCGGISGFLEVGALCAAHGLDLSAHTAPALHVHPCCALRAARHVEYFHDHVRIERLLFDGAPEPRQGRLAPDLSRPGLGLTLRVADAERYEVGP